MIKLYIIYILQNTIIIYKYIVIVKYYIMLYIVYNYCIFKFLHIRKIIKQCSWLMITDSFTRNNIISV